MSWKTKQYLGMGLIAIALFLVWTLDVATSSRISALREAIKEREATVAERENILAAVKKFQQDYTAQAADAQRFAALVPPRKSTAELVSEIEAMAAQSGITVTNLSTSGNPATGGAYQELNLRLEARGAYAALVSFLAAAERNIRLLDMQTIEISTDAAQASVLTIQLQAKTYFLN